MENIETIHVIRMLLNRFQADEDVENVVELVYSVFFHLISLHMDLDTKKV